MGKKDRHPGRRGFLQSGALAAFAAGMLPIVHAPEKKKAPERNVKNIRKCRKDIHYRQLGNTDMHLSVLSLGGAGLETALAFHAIERGVNLVHIGYDCRSSKPMGDLAEVLKTERDNVYVALKDGFQKEAPDDIDPILKLLGTDRVDFMMFNRRNAEAVNDPAICEGFENWKSQGKVRYCGLTSHDQLMDKEAAIASVNELPAGQRHDGNCLACRKCESVCPNGIRIVPKLNATTRWFRNLSHGDLS